MVAILFQPQWDKHPRAGPRTIEQVGKHWFKGLRPFLEGFVVPVHDGAWETGSQIPRANALRIWRTVRTSPSALRQQTLIDWS